MKVGGAVAVLGIGMAASQIGTPHLLTTYECDTDGRKCVRCTQCFYIGRAGGNSTREWLLPRIARA